MQVNIPYMEHLGYIELGKSSIYSCDETGRFFGLGNLWPTPWGSWPASMAMKNARRRVEGFHKWGVPQNGEFVGGEPQSKMDDLGVPPFQETSGGFRAGFGSQKSLQNGRSWGLFKWKMWWKWVIWNLARCLTTKRDGKVMNFDET